MLRRCVVKDFKSYTDNNQGTGGEDTAQGLSNLISQLAGRYEGASEEQIISAIIAEAERGKRNGTLTNGDIDSFATALSGMLSEGQRKKLKKVVAYLKSIN